MVLLCGSVWLAGCGGDESTEANAPTTMPTVVTSGPPAPTYGTQSGMGFPTGDALHADGSGSGMMGFNGVGKMGTSGTITDEHPISKPEKMPTTDPVLPPS